ncbi:hypothetical protein ACLI4J_27715, partial [Pseudomonas aeruginosa]
PPGVAGRAAQAMRTSVGGRADFAAGWLHLYQLRAERGCAAPARQAQGCARALQPGEARFAAALPQAVAPAARCAELPACPVGAPPR